MQILSFMLFTITKIQNFESNSQHLSINFNVIRLFTITKIQNFESNSQRGARNNASLDCCLQSQRYKILKAIHNVSIDDVEDKKVVYNHKDTKF